MSHGRIDLARYIEHTLLAPDATRDAIRKLCREAIEHNFLAVCVNGRYAGLANECLLAGAGTRLVVVVGFPLGAGATSAKVQETVEACSQGADEIDMVIPIGALIDRDDASVASDISAVVRAAEGRPVKTILEVCLLTDEQITRACRIATESGAAFVKTSTGFAKSGATPEAVRLMRASAPANVGVKAAGGIRDAETADAMLAAGANRLGVSAGVAIITGSTTRSDY